jgi:hypothetical protein
MECILSNRVMPWNVQSKEFVCTVAGGVVFAVATVALCYFLLSAPSSLNLAHMVSFSLLSAATLSGLGTFAAGMYFYSKKQKQEREEFVQDLTNPVPVEIEEEIDLGPVKISFLDYIADVRKDLPPLFDALQEFLQAFIIGYHNSEGRKVGNNSNMRKAFENIRAQIDSFLQNPEEVLRASIGIATFALVDENKIGPLLAKRSQVIAKLADTLTPKDKYSAQLPLIGRILRVIASRAELADEVLQSRILALQEAYKNMDAIKDAKKREEKRGEYKIALLCLIDYLYEKAKKHITQEQINMWTSHLIPSFLDEWRGDLFSIIQSGMDKLKEAFKPKGIFHNKTYKRLLSTLGDTWAGKKVVYSKIEEYMEAFPLPSNRKSALLDAAKSIYPEIINPFYHGTFDTSHVFCQRVTGIINALDTPKAQENTWKSYIDTYEQFFKDIAAKLRG